MAPRKKSQLTVENKKKIWKLSCKGKSNAEIAKLFAISVTHVGRVLRDYNEAASKLVESKKKNGEELTLEQTKKITLDEITEEERHNRIVLLKNIVENNATAQEKLNTLVNSPINSANATAIRNLYDAVNKGFDLQNKLYSQLRALEMETADDIEVGWDWVIREEKEGDE